MRKTYIENNDITVYDKYLESFNNLLLKDEIINTIDSLNRVTSKSIYAQKCDPMYNASAMDGIEVLSENTLDASNENPKILKLGIDFDYVNTGNPIKKEYNSVIMIEDVLVIDDETVSIIKPSYPYQNIRVKGESIVEGEMVLKGNSVIRAQDIGAIYASCNDTISVYKKPVVGIIPTGNEMVNDKEELKNGKLMESNSKMFKALVETYYGIPKIYDICLDDKNLLKEKLLKAVNECDLVIVNAGSSAGTKDYTVDVINELGSVFAHGIAIKPGKPTILGVINNKPVIGIPGYPVSAYLVFDLFVKPIILKMQGLKENNSHFLECTLTRSIVSSLKNAEYVRMNIGFVNNKYYATPLERGAAQIMSLVKADGLLYIDRLSEGYNEGDLVKVKLIKPLSTIKNNLSIIGSHDLIIDVISDTLDVSSAHVGSMGGIFSLLKNECHIAPIHLLDTSTGVYNISYIKKYFKNQKMVLIKGVGRTQGILEKKGLNTKTIKEISLNNIPFANRQAGSGTRILFDYLLDKDGIDKDTINGYQKEYTTHLSVGVAIDNDTAKVGIGIKSIARILDLDFYPLYNEEYDFLTTYENYNDQRVQDFINVLRSDDFKNKVLELKDYTVDNLGKVIIIEND